MQGLYNILMTIEIISGLLIVFLVLTQKSSSDGLISRVTNPFNNATSRLTPATKFTGTVVLVFLLNSLLLTIVHSKSKKTSSILNETIEKELIPTDDYE